MDWSRITAGAPPVVAIVCFAAMAAADLLTPQVAGGFILATVLATIYPRNPPPASPAASPVGVVDAMAPQTPTIAPFVALGVAAAACAI